MIRRALTVLAGAAILVGIGGARPAHAMRCDESIEPVCAVVATVVCKIVAKGQPCLM